MKRFIVFSCVCFLIGFTFTGCERGGVQAGGENGDYQPRPAPTIEDPEIEGELLRVDPATRTIQVRLESGMLQTFKFDDSTVVEGLPKSKQAKAARSVSNGAKVRSLTGNEGAEVTIQWIDDDGDKLATHIEVTQLNGKRRR